MVKTVTLVPTELTEYTEAYGLRNLNPQNSLRFARREFTELKGIFGMVKTVTYTELKGIFGMVKTVTHTELKGIYYWQSFLWILSYDA